MLEAIKDEQATIIRSEQAEQACKCFETLLLFPSPRFRSIKRYCSHPDRFSELSRCLLRYICQRLQAAEETNDSICVPFRPQERYVDIFLLAVYK